MIRHVFSSLIVTLLALLSFGKVHSQIIINRPGADTMKVVYVNNADRISYLRTDSATEMEMLSGNVRITQGKTVFNCDSAVLNKKTRFMEAFGNVHIIDNDTVHIRSQYLQYFVDTKIANLKNNVSLTDNKSTLLTNELKYDLNTKVGEYHNGGKLLNETTVLTSKEGTYYEELKDVYFKKNVDLKDPKYTLRTDSLIYNTATQIATFIAPTTIVDSAKRTIKTSDGFYDTRNRKAFFGKRPVLTDGPVRIIADNIDSDDSTGISKLRGNAVYVDTAQGVSVLANFIEAKRDDGTFRATQHPVMIIKQDKDSIYITADTLYSGRLSKLPAKPIDTLHRDSTKKVVPAVAKTDISGNKKPLTADSLHRDSTKKEVPALAKTEPAPADSTKMKGRDAVDKYLKMADSVHRDTAKLIVPEVAKQAPQFTDSLHPDTTKLIVPDLAKTDVLGNKKSDSAKKEVPAVAKTGVPGNKKSDNAKKAGPAVAKTGVPGNKKTPKAPAGNKPVKAQSNENKNDSTDRYFQAWHHVRIFSDSMQAVSDSLWYSGKDSTFRLYTDPVMWASNSQITGDTIYLFTKNKNPDRIYCFENGFAINLSDTLMYNQIKGNRLNGYFVDGAINYMRAQGNAESIYYVKDDKDYLVGINNATSDIIDMRFKNKELHKVVFISDVNGTLYPIRQATEQNKYLRNFKWQEDKRPKTKFELFEDIRPPKIITDDSTQIVPPKIEAKSVKE